MTVFCRRSRERKGRERNAAEFVYVAGYEDSVESGPVKVGYTSSLKSRLSDLSTGNDKKLVYFHLLPVYPGKAREVESRAHSILWEHNVRGEWFGCSPSVAYDAIEQAAMMIDNIANPWVHRMIFPKFEKYIRFPDKIYSSL